MTILARTALKNPLRGELIRYGIADRMLEGIEGYKFDLDSVEFPKNRIAKTLHGMWRVKVSNSRRY